MQMLRFLVPLISCFFLCAAPAARAQWVVYDARVTPVVEVSENFVPYTGIYFIAPVTGGTASMILLTEDGGRFYSVSENGARYFTAAGQVGRLAVLSALANGGTAQAMYQCVGILNSTLSYTKKGVREGGRVSTSMLGHMLASDDESLAATPGPDGSIGMVGTAQINATLRIDLSRILNENDLTMSQAVASIVGLLEKYGYQPDDGTAAPAPTSAVVTSTAEKPATSTPPVTPPTVQPAPATTDPTPISIFPPGAMEQMEKSLKEPLTK